MSDGHEITNSNATRGVTNFSIDDRTGFKVYPGELIRDGHMNIYTMPKSYDPRHPQEFVRGTVDRYPGSRSPEQEDTFITDEITQDDL